MSARLTRMLAYLCSTFRFISGFVYVNGISFRIFFMHEIPLPSEDCILKSEFCVLFAHFTVVSDTLAMVVGVLSAFLNSNCVCAC